MITISSYNVESVKTDIMNSSKRQTTPLSISSVSPQSLFDGVRLRLENFSRIQWATFVASPSGGGARTSCFIRRRHDPGNSRFNEVR